MAKALSLEIRKAVVNAYNRGQGTISKLSDIFNISSRAIDKFLYIDRNGGDLSPRKPTGRPGKITEKHHQIIRNMVRNYPDKILSEYCDMFYKKTEIKVGTSIMDRAFKKLDIRRKKKSYFASEQDRKDVKKKRRFHSFIRAARS